MGGCGNVAGCVCVWRLIRNACLKEKLHTENSKFECCIAVSFRGRERK